MTGTATIRVSANFFLAVIGMADVATQCGSITAGNESSLPLMQQLVIRLVLADHQIAVCVVASRSIDVVDRVAGIEKFTNGPLSDKNVL